MTRLRILAVGKLQKSFMIEAAEYYRKKILRWHHLDERCIKDADSALPNNQRIAYESKALLATLTSDDIAVCMDERGDLMTSMQFAEFFDGLLHTSSKTPCFIIGGPFGFDDTLRSKARHLISLSPMTLPHEMARVMLLEQIYRAETIIRHIPYHH